MLDETVQILLIEDESAHAELVRRAFEARGDHTRLTVVGTLAEARRCLADHSSPPTLIIADWRLPDGEGIKLLTERLPFKVPVVIMTSYGNERVAVEAIKAGALDYVVKSETTLIDMPHVVERVLREWTMAQEQARIEAALRQSEERYRTLVQTLPDAITVINVQGKLVYVSPLTLRIYGFESEDEILGRNPFEWVHTAYQQQALEAMQLVLAGQSVRNQEYLLIKKDGTTFWGELSASCLKDAQGAVAGTIIITRDVSERKRAEAALQHYVERLTTLHQIDQAILAAQSIEAVAEAALNRLQHLVPIRQARVVLLEPEAGEAVVVAAWREGEIRQRDVHCPLIEFEITEDLRQGRLHVVNDLTLVAMPSPAEQRGRASGIRTYLGVPLNTQERLIGVLELEAVEAGVFHDAVSEIAREIADQLVIAIQQSRLFEQIQRHAAELEQRVADRTRELAAANEELTELDRLKSKFVSDVSHELRTPITNLKLYGELLERGKPEKQAHYITVLRQQTQRLSQLVEDILDLSRLDVAGQPVTFGPADLNAIIDQIMTAQRPRAEAAGLALTFTSTDNLPLVCGDVHQLSQVITNLVANALNYTVAGFVHVTTTLEDGGACLCVEDSGMGIEAEDLPHIFDRFYRGRHTRKRDVPGTGLGLAIAKEIVELHSGRIEVDSRVNQGTTFRVYLPICR